MVDAGQILRFGKLEVKSPCFKIIFKKSKISVNEFRNFKANYSSNFILFPKDT